MKKVLFLSSMLIMTAFNAFADDAAPNTDKKITGGAGTCTADVLGVSDNNATANTIATWSLNSYDCAAGQYLDETTLECIECPTGSYCPGGTFTVEANNSKTACPADYTSDAAATAESECYMGCELVCTQQTCPEHSENCTHGVSVINGAQYYGQSTCDALPRFCSMDFACKTGYTKVSTIMNYILNDIYAKTFDESGIDSPVVHFDTCDATMETCTAILQWRMPEFGDTIIAIMFEYRFNNDKNIIQNNKIKDLDINGRGEPIQISVLSYDTNISMDNNFSVIYARPSAFVLLTQNLMSELSILQTELEKDFADGLITEEEATEKFSEFEARLLKPMNLPWMALINSEEPISYNDPEGWAEFAVQMFLLLTMQTPFFVDAVYGDISYVRCDKNIININWNPDNGKDTIQDMCYYDGAIRVPDDPVKPGYTFMGWKLAE